MKKSITIIVAAAENNAIGKDNDLIWSLPNDLKRFKKLTSGHSIIMGRKTFDSFPGLLPNRKHIVISRNKNISFSDEVTVVNNFEDAIRETDYYLTANKFKTSNKNITEDDLFGSKQNRYSIISLLKEYKNADYFLKIEDEDVNAIPIKRILFELNQIKHIVTAYLINTEDLKQKERLVFK